ncbi:MAG TPA: cytochrome c3 family protein [Stellaceae bacterium]|nr:cytochrome c3 family protein [Stellaceae bacterium]
MQVEITILTVRGSATMRRSLRVSAGRLRFGRGTDNEVPLADIRVPLAAAVMSQRIGGLSIEQSGELPLRVNGGSAHSANVGPGDEIDIGPYRIVLSEPAEGLDAALSVELVRPMGDALDRILRHSRIGLEHTHLSRRRASWALFLAILVLCLAAPIVAYLAGQRVTAPTAVPAAGGASVVFRGSWNPGQLSNAHRYFAHQCSTCHRAPFRAVEDAACLTCHSGVGAHIPAGATGLAAIGAKLAGERCADCHVEHRGLRSLVIGEGTLCLTCHRALAQTAPAAAIRDVGGFPKGHPQFRASVVADAAGPRLARVEIGPKPVPADHPGLVFSHQAHLRPDGFPVLHIKPLACAQCHAPNGRGFLPITFKGQCQSCHRLRFAIGLPWKEVPHGDDRAVAGALEGFYAALVVKHGIPVAAAAPQIERRLPHSRPAAPLPSSARDWVAQQTRSALAVVFKSKEGCFYCHLPDPKLGAFRVAPVQLSTRFLPMALFDHVAHRAIACEDCHAARQSRSSADLLIPGKERCTACHGAENAAFKAQSTCISCHIFHLPRLGPMRQTAAPRIRQRKGGS